MITLVIEKTLLKNATEMRATWTKVKQSSDGTVASIGLGGSWQWADNPQNLGRLHAYTKIVTDAIDKCELVASFLPMVCNSKGLKAKAGSHTAWCSMLQTVCTLQKDIDAVSDLVSELAAATVARAVSSTKAAKSGTVAKKATKAVS